VAGAPHGMEPGAKVQAKVMAAVGKELVPRVPIELAFSDK